MIYFLSILDGLSGALGGLAAVAFGVAVASIVVPAFASSMSYSERDREHARAVSDAWKPWRARAGVTFGVLVLLNAAIPTTDSLIKAWAIVEGSKIANAENAEAATKALLERADKLIEAIGKRSE